MSTKIERGFEIRSVSWAGAAESGPVLISGINRAASIYLPAGFAGTTLEIEVETDDGWKRLAEFTANVQASVAANKVNILPAGVFNVAGTIRFVLDQVETLTAELHLVS